MALIKTTFYAKQGSSSGTAGSSTSGFTKNITTVTNTDYASVADRLATPRIIWGQEFDGTQDITGNFLLENAAMNVYGPWKAGSYYSEISYVAFHPTNNADEFSSYDFRRTNVELEDSWLNFFSNDNGNILKLDTTGIFQKIANKEMNLNADGLSWTGDAIISSEGELTIRASKINMDLGRGDLHADNAYFNNIGDNGAGSVTFVSPVIMNQGMQLNGDLHVEDLYSNNIYNQNEIVTKDITVTGQMHVFDLVIEQISAAGGQVILSAAEFHIDDFEEGRSVSTSVNYGVAGDGLTDSSYKTLYLYQIAVDQAGQKIRNQWKPFDHAICYTANVDESGTVDIRSWWTLVWSVATGVSRTINGESVVCNMIEIVRHVTPTSGTETDPSWGNVSVEIGDNVCLLGSHNADRQAAIVMSAHKSFDVNITAPSIVQYDGINGFTLDGKAKTYFAKNGNKIRGQLIIDSTGQNIEDIISGIQHGYQVYVHTAYAHDDHGTGFVRASEKTSSDYEYIGFRSDYEPDDSTYTWDMYEWTRIKGEAGDTEETDKLIPVRERLYLATDDNLYLDICYHTGLWTQANTVKYSISAYNGSTTPQQTLTDTSSDTVYFTGLVQQKWSTLTNDNRYYMCVVSLYDANNQLIDQHTLNTTFDAGAVLSITDTITARVSDAEGNISTLSQTAQQLLSRIQSNEGSISELRQTASSLEARIQTAEGRLDMIIDPTGITADIQGVKDDVNQLKIDVNGLKQTTSTLQTSIDGLTDTQNQFTVGINGLTNRLQQVEQQYSNLDGSLTTIRTRMSAIEQTISQISLSVKDVIVGGENLLNYTDFGVQPDEDVKSAWQTDTKWLQNHKNGKRVSTLIRNSGAYGPRADGSAGYFEVMSDPNNVDPAYEMFHQDSYGHWYMELLRQSVKGKLKPNTWYTLSFYANGLTTYRTLATYVFPNVVNQSSNIIVNGRDTGQHPSDCYVSWVVDNDSPISNNNWRKYWVTFKTRSDLSSNADVYVLWRGWSDTYEVEEDGEIVTKRRYPYFVISQPKLEEGNVATDYSYSKRDWESAITVKANEIELNVRDGLKNTGIDITSGEIDINADLTTIHGNLSLRETDGLTLYDAQGNARVMVQPTNIGNLDSLDSGVQQLIRFSGVRTVTSATVFDVTTTESVLGTAASNTNISVSNIGVYVTVGTSGADNDGVYVTNWTRPGYMTMELYILNTSGQTVGSATYTLPYNSASNRFTPQYTASQTLTYRVTNSGQYRIKARVYAPANSQSFPVQTPRYVLMMTVAANVNIESDHHTLIGLDGMHAFAGPYKEFAVGTDGIMALWGENGIRIQNQSSSINNGQIRPMNGVRIPVVTSQTGNFITWISPYNYRPLYELSSTDIVSTYIKNMGETKYAYQIKPTDTGDLLVMWPKRTDYGNLEDIWILLPDELWRVGNVIHRLPAGWRIRIINSITEGRPVYVTINKTFFGASEGTAGARVEKILDDNLNYNLYSRLTSTDGRNDTFVWTGWDWRQFRDTQ